MARRRAPAKTAASAVTERVTQHWTSRVLPLLAAPAGLGVLAVAIIVMHRAWGGSPVRTPLWAVAVAMLGTAASGYAWVAAGGHRGHLRGLSVLTTAACTVAVVAGLIAGMAAITGPYLLGGLFLSVLWGIRHVMKAAGEGEGGHPLGKLGEAIGAERHHVFNIKRSGKGTVTATVQAKDGATIDEFQPSLPALQAAAGIPRGAATLRPDEDDASIGHLEVTVADLLKKPIPWPGPARVGALCTAPIPLGIYSNGDEFEGRILTSDEDIEHDLIVGVTGSGKSEFCVLLLGTLLMRRQVSCIGIDCSKGLQTFGPIAHGLTSNGLLVTEFRNARQVLKALSGPVCRARTEYLTSQGMTKWAPVTPSGRKTAINFLDVWVEEAADLSDGETYAEMCRRVRSAGIKVHTSQQRAAWDEMQTKTRSNHGGGIAFGCRDEESARFCLPDDLVDAGALPLWRNRKPGYHYMAALRAEPENWQRVLRGYLVDRRQLAAAITAAANVRTPMDDITATALGTLWTDRTVYPAPLGLPAITAGHGPAAITEAHADAYTAAALTPQQAPPALTITDTDHEDDDLEVELTDADRNEIDEASEDILGGLVTARRAEIDAVLAGADWHEDATAEYDDPGDDLDTAAPDITDTPLDLADDTADGEVTADEARRLLHTQLDAWYQSGKREFSPRDLYPLMERLGRGRRWFYHLRDDLVDDGVIAEGHEIGSYDLIRSPFAGAIGTGAGDAR